MVEGGVYIGEERERRRERGVNGGLREGEA